MRGFLPRPSLPIIPADILARFHVNEPRDTRFASSARLIQSIWRDRHGYLAGSFVDEHGEIRTLGNLLTDAVGRSGAAFLSTDIARFVRRDIAYREVGALVDERRLWTNLLSSHPLCYNLFAPLCLDAELATVFLSTLLPDFVAEVLDIAFEHSPGRGQVSFTGDHTAFDVMIIVRTVLGRIGFVAIEVKYSETLASQLRPTGRRLDELASQSRLFTDPAARELRQSPLQQFWREHLLAFATLQKNAAYEEGRFIVIHPALNDDVGRGVDAYQRHLVDTTPAQVGFQCLHLETCIAALMKAGATDLAEKLTERYLDFSPIEALIADWQPPPLPDHPPADK